MNDKSQALQDDIAFMRDMAQAGASAPLVSGSILVACGAVFGAISVIHWTWFRFGDPKGWMVATMWIGAAVLFASRPYLMRPSGRATLAALWLSALGAVGLVEGLPTSVLGTVALGWGAAAVAHLAFGSPAATPSTMTNGASACRWRRVWE